MADNRTCARRAIVARCVELIDDLVRLENAVEAAPPGTLTATERRSLLLTLDMAWTEIGSARPKMPRRRKGGKSHG